MKNYTFYIIIITLIIVISKTMCYSQNSDCKYPQRPNLFWLKESFNTKKYKSYEKEIEKYDKCQGREDRDKKFTAFIKRSKEQKEQISKANPTINKSDKIELSGTHLLNCFDKDENEILKEIKIDSDYYFNFDSFEIDNSFKANSQFETKLEENLISKIKCYLEDTVNTKISILITVDGYSEKDNVENLTKKERKENEDYNQELSEDRAKEVGKLIENIFEIYQIPKGLYYIKPIGHGSQEKSGGKDWKLCTVKYDII